METGKRNAEALAAALMKVQDTLPLMMDTMFVLIARYLDGRTGEAAFLSEYPDEAVPLYRRIALGYKHEEYAALYAAEIALVRAVSAACEAEAQNGAGALRAAVEAAAETYLATPVTRRKTFLS